ncbi:unnamed protein product, partial [Tenebrio molitor]
VRFSVLVNETTDISTMKLLCILVNYVSPETGKVTRLLELSHLDARDCAADALFNAFKICLDNKNISLNNLLCVASDEASVMWRNLPFTFTETEINDLSTLAVDEMWKKIGSYTDFEGTYVFKNIYELAIIILTLPHSNAEAERIFS